MLQSDHEPIHDCIVLLIAVSLSACQPLQGSLQPTNVVFDGNSLTAGSGSSPGNSYPEQVMRLLPRSYTGHNLGVSAQTTVQMTADAAVQVDALVDPSARNILIVWEATNDLFFGASSETAYRHLASYCQDRQRAGYQVIVLTLLPRSCPGTPASSEDARQAVNAQIRANWPSFADAQVDAAADPRLGPAGRETDRAYFADRVHLTDAGYRIVAGLVADQIKALQDG